MKLTKARLKRIIKEEVYRRFLTTDDVERIYRDMGKPVPESFYDIKMTARAYDSGVTGEDELRQGILNGTVKR